MHKIKLLENPLYVEDIKKILDIENNFFLLKGKTVLITGATGLIGTVLSNMFEFLAEYYDLQLKLILVSRGCQSKVVNGDFIEIRNICCDLSKDSLFNICKEIKIDYIFHLASNVHPLQYAEFPISTITTNVWGTKDLLDLVSLNPGCRFIFASSVEVYGDIVTSSEGANETDFGFLDCNTVRACYNESKRLCETLCQAYKSEKNIDFVIARLCRSYGPTLKKDDSKALSQFLFNAIKGKNVVLKSSGIQYYSYLYSVVAASALIFLLFKGISGEAYNVSDVNSNVYLKDLAKIVADQGHVSVVFEIPSEVEKKGFSRAVNAVINPKKINELGWRASYDIASGIKRTFDIMKMNFV